MQGLEFPASFHEFAGQPVEQFGMRGPLAERAEITRRINDAAAKMIEPKTIDENARDGGMATTGEPPRVGEPPPGRTRGQRLGLEHRRLERGQHGEFTGLDGLLRLVVIAAIHDERGRYRAL